MDQSTELLTRLNVIRRTVRRRLVVYGACAVLAGSAFAFLTIITLDWLLWFPPFLRLVGAVMFFIGFVMAILHWIVKPLQAPFGLEELAGHGTESGDGLGTSTGVVTPTLTSSTE